MKWFCFGSHAGWQNGGVLIVDLLVLIAVGRYGGRVDAFRAWRWRITCWSVILLDQLELKDTKVNSTECVWVLLVQG